MTEKQARKNRRARGQIIPRGENTFQIRVPTGRDAASGSRLYHTETLNGTATQAEKRRTKLLAQLDDGTFVEPSRASLEAFFKEWLNQKQREGVREITLQNYKDAIDIYILPHVGAKRLAKLTPRDVQSIYNHMQDRGLSTVTIKGVRNVLKMAFNQAVTWHYLVSNPAADIKLPAAANDQGVKHTGGAMDEDEARAFLQTASEQPDDLIFVFWLFTGLRPEEMIGLQWSELELVREFDQRRETFVERGIARIRRTVVLRRGGAGISVCPSRKAATGTCTFPRRSIKSCWPIKSAKRSRPAGQGRLELTTISSSRPGTECRSNAATCSRAVSGLCSSVRVCPQRSRSTVCATLTRRFHCSQVSLTR